MKRVVSISLGPGDLDVSFRSRFLGETFAITRIGTDKDHDRAAALVIEALETMS